MQCFSSCTLSSYLVLSEYTHVRRTDGRTDGQNVYSNTVHMLRSRTVIKYLSLPCLGVRHLQCELTAFTRWSKLYHRTVFSEMTFNYRETGEDLEVG